MEILKIYEGWKNNLFPAKELKKIINKVHKERMDICNKCDEHSPNKIGYKTIRVDNHCTVCLCTTNIKTKCLSCECPLGYWKAELNENQEQEINSNYGK
jgi:hypothetical protein